MSRRTVPRTGQRFARSAVFGAGAYTGRNVIKTGSAGVGMLAIYGWFGIAAGRWMEFWWLGALGLAFTVGSIAVLAYYERLADGKGA